MIQGATKNDSQNQQLDASRILALPAGLDVADDYTDHQLRDMVRLLERAGESFACRHQSLTGRAANIFYSGRMQDTKELFGAFRFCNLLRSQGNFEKSLKGAASILFGGALMHQVDDMFQDTQLHIGKTKSTISRARLSIDAAIMITERAANDDCRYFRVGWTDSSPILGYKF